MPVRFTKKVLTERCQKYTKTWAGKVLDRPGSLDKRSWMQKNPFLHKHLHEIQNVYDSGYGMKILSREIGISYTNFRTIFLKYLGLKCRTGTNVITKKLREFRKEKAAKEGYFKNWPTTMPFLLQSRGLQGWYESKQHGKKIWLRSSWEFIYCRWLEEQGILYDYELRSFKLKSGKSYRPDFFLQNNTIIEIKAPRYNDRKWKYEAFKEEFPEYNLVVITDVKPYCKRSYVTDIKEWKKIIGKSKAYK